ncbi:MULTISPECIES: undecaprenyldiphospho-muramoylpentapeptide beta-N-acetylglucosaminyltransferase [Rheinheimera]|uniref:UDP-N-acetylglucosamine--N-acetylmuramyl-(pentapeptide) pyrophosphoryl-undecaprenol N-acetylglucosamine transferase n=1 Tax=Rheinheimera marina TaxID=1774958 RepID=A0ABV9JPA7_9GAMM
MAKVALVMAGGTGGHIFPAKAVADLLTAEGWTVHWLGTADRMEAKLVPGFGYAFHSIAVAGLRGKGLMSLLKAPLMLWRSLSQAQALVRQLKPQLVLGFGGYASGPGGLAAYLAGIPLLVHEQNAVAGTTNKLLARLAAKVLVAFPQALAGLGKGQVVGNPVRKEVLALAGQSKAAGLPLRVLVVGGSLGAQVFNQQLPKQFAQLSAQGPLEIWHQTGQADAADVQAQYQQLGLQARSDAFIQDMAQAYGWADLVVCRAGALTVSELACAGLPAVFVPLPSAIDDHQTANANFLVQQQGAVLLKQNELMQGALVPLLQPWLQDKTALVQMGQNARRAATDDAAEQVVRVCRELAGNTK